ncbi:MAG: hypothetical protein QMC80_08530 [Thermoplasmatales archaeon]|nr:hypothetical protein [Thermoplasmatales archaeon]
MENKNKSGDEGADKGWVIKSLENAGILKLRGSSETKEGGTESFFAEVMLTDRFTSCLAMNLTNLCTIHKSIDRYEEVVAGTVREMLNTNDDISRHVSLVLTVLKANRITKEKLEAKLMQGGFLAAK